MPTFIFRWKRGLFWRSRRIAGFINDKERDRMLLSFEDGSLLELSRWSRCDCRLGEDYFKFLKRRMEEQTGTAIPSRETPR